MKKKTTNKVCINEIRRLAGIEKIIGDRKDAHKFFTKRPKAYNAFVKFANVAHCNYKKESYKSETRNNYIAMID